MVSLDKLSMNTKWGKNQLYGSIEVDESYFGAKRQRGYHGKLKRGRGTLKTTCIWKSLNEMVGFIPKSFQIAQLNRYKPLSWVKYHLIVLSIQMGGVAIMAWLMWVMLNTFG